MNDEDYLIKFKELLLNNKEIYLRVKVRLNADKTCVKELMVDETIKIDLSKPAVNNKANKELIEFLSRQFKVAGNGIKIISGAASRVKLIKIINLEIKLCLK